MSQKLGSNRCPLFTMLTKQNSSMFCVVSFVKKTCLFVFLTCSISTHLKTPPLFFSFFFFLFSFSFLFLLSFLLSLFFLLTSDPIRRSPLTRTNILRGWANLRSRPSIPLNQNQNLCGWANLRSRPAIPFNQNQNLRGWANLRSRPAILFNQNQYPAWLG